MTLARPHPVDHDRDGKVLSVLVVEGLANLVVLGLKIVVGLMSGSMAVLGDAIHSLGDLLNNVIAWFVVRMSRQPADREHPYGHRKFETLAVFGLAGLLTVLGIELALRAVQRESVEVVTTQAGFLLMLGVLAINIGLATWERRWARRLDSDILHADANHTLSDVATTVIVIIGWQLSAVGYVWLDTVCAIGVAGFVLYLAYRLFMRVIPVLVDEFAVDPNELSGVVWTVPGVRAIERVRSRSLGKSSAVDLVITVDPELSTKEAHLIADRIEALIEHRFKVDDISIHIEPHEPL
jgi:cation diffusion facilitator family transporter